MAFGQFHHQIGAEAVFIVQHAKGAGVEPLRAARQLRAVGAPVGNGVAVVHIGRLQNRLPQPFHSRLRFQLREHLPRPPLRGYGANAPGEFVIGFPPPEALQGFARGDLGALDAVGVAAFEVLRVRRVNGQPGSAFRGHLFKKVRRPRVHRIEHLIRRAQILFPRQRIVVPIHDHFAAAHIVRRRRAQPGKPRLVHRAVDGQQLPLLHVQPFLQQQPGIRLLPLCECFIHMKSLPFRHMLYYLLLWYSPSLRSMGTNHARLYKCRRIAKRRILSPMGNSRSSRLEKQWDLSRTRA